jgi:hypothetical protein
MEMVKMDHFFSMVSIIIIGLSWVGVKMCFGPNGIAGFGDLNLFLRYLE